MKKTLLFIGLICMISTTVSPLSIPTGTIKKINHYKKSAINSVKDFIQCLKGDPSCNKQKIQATRAGAIVIAALTGVSIGSGVYLINKRNKSVKPTLPPEEKNEKIKDKKDQTEIPNSVTEQPQNNDKVQSLQKNLFRAIFDKNISAINTILNALKKLNIDGANIYAPEDNMSGSPRTHVLKKAIANFFIDSQGFNQARIDVINTLLAYGARPSDALFENGQDTIIHWLNHTFYPNTPLQTTQLKLIKIITGAMDPNSYDTNGNHVLTQSIYDFTHETLDNDDLLFAIIKALLTKKANITMGWRLGKKESIEYVFNQESAKNNALNVQQVQKLKKVLQEFAKKSSKK